MPIVTADIKVRLSVPTASAGDATAQGSVNNSLGKYMSTTPVTDNTINNLFDDVTGDENASHDVEYRCIFIYNSHATLTWQNPMVWLSAEVAGGANAAIGIDTTAASAHNATGVQALTVVDEGTAPVGVTFSSPTTKAGGLALGSLAPLQCRAVWVRRTANDTTALNNDGVTISVEGDTMA
jgi:hypothetical protein